MNPIGTAFASTREHLKIAARKNRGHLRFNVLCFSAMILAVAAWIALAQVPEERFPWSGSLAHDAKRCRISGQVTMQGRPINRGQIRFSCQTTPVEYFDDFLASAPISVPIIDGEYGITQNHPLSPGLYLVTIQTPEELSSPANSSPLPVWCDASESALRFRAGRSLLIRINDSADQTLHFELEAGCQVNFGDIH